VRWEGVQVVISAHPGWEWGGGICCCEGGHNVRGQMYTDVKKVTCKSKGTLRHVFYLSEAPYPPMTQYSPFLTHCIRVYSILVHTEKGVGEGGGS
jgi:hypothetical protein